MVGYPESLTDPSYRGQILVLTFPLVGNYGVPSRETMDPLLKDLPKHFESNEIHIAGLIVGQYSQDFSHYLATSSLGAWLKEFNIPAIYGIDTRAMTKKIRSQGVMLGKILFPISIVGPTVIPADAQWMGEYQNVDWVDPNARNLVAEGMLPLSISGAYCSIARSLSILSVSKQLFLLGFIFCRS
jgi:carbamoyl-phosphate synthase/aspartate carbamoyltransferase